MKTNFFSVILITGLLFLASSCKQSPSTNATTDKDTDAVKVSMPMPPSSGKDDQLRSAMHKLWEDHVVWTRNVIFCMVDNLPGGDQATQRLLQNQDDIGNAVKAYYGADAGTRLSTLLREHIMIAADVIKAAKVNNKEALDKANKAWFDNADAISAFLSGANTNWPLGDMKMMMHDHLKLTTDEVVARIKKDYDGDIKAYDKVHEEILKMSDMLTDGIVKQFPDKFN